MQQYNAGRHVEVRHRTQDVNEVEHAVGHLVLILQPVNVGVERTSTPIGIASTNQHPMSMVTK